MRFRSKKKLAAFIGACVLLSLLAIAVFLHAPTVQSYVLGKAVDYLRTKAGILLGINHLDYNLFALNVYLDGCSLRSTTNPHLPPFLTAQRVSLHLSLMDLLRGNMPVRTASLSGLGVHVAIAPNGESNLPKPPSGENTAPKSIQVPELRVTDSSFRYDDLQQNLSIYLPKWSLKVERTSSPGRMHARFDSLQQGTLMLRRQVDVISRVILDTEIDTAGAQIKEFLLDTGVVRATVHGSVTVPEARMDLKVDAVARLRQLTTFLGLTANPEGELSLHAQATGQPAALEIRSRLSGVNLSVLGYRNLEVSADSSWMAAEGVLDIDSLSLISDGGTILGSARLATGSGESSRVRLELSNWNLQPISTAFDLPVRLVSRAVGSVDAGWPGTKIDQASGKATIRLAPSASVIRGNLLPLTATVVLTQERGRTELKIPSAEVPGLRIVGEGSARNFEAISGDALIRVPDLGALGESLRRLIGSSFPDIPSPLNGSLDLQASVGGTLTHPSLKLELDGRQIDVGAISGMSVQASLSADPDRIRIGGSRIDWAGSSMTVMGDLLLSQSPHAMNIHANLVDASLADIRSALNINLPAAGKIDARIDIQGTLSIPAIKAEANIRGLQAYDESLGDLEAAAVMANQRLELQRLSLTRNSSPSDIREILSARGYYDLKQQTYEIHADARSIELRSLILPGGLPLRGNFSIAVGGAGPVSDPSLVAQLDFRELRVGKSDFGRLYGDAQLGNQFAKIGIKAPDLNISASGTLNLRPPYAARAEVLAQATDFERLGLDLASGTALQGSISGSITAEGNAQDWQQAEMDVRIQEVHVAFKDRVIANQSPIRITLAKGIANIGQFALSEKGAAVQISGSIPLFDPERSGHVEIAGQADLGALADSLPPELGISVAGTTSFNARIDGTRNAARVSGTASLRNGSLVHSQMPIPLTQAEADLRLQDGVLFLDRLEGKLAGGTLHFGGELPLSWLPENLPIHLAAGGTGVSHTTLDLDGISLASIPDIPSGLTGAISLHAEAEARKPDIEDVKADIRLEKLDLAFDDYRIAQTSPSIIAIDGGVVRLQQFALAGTGTDLKGTGSAELRGAGAVSLQLRGQAAAGLLTFFSRNLNAAGEISVEVDVENTIQDPRITGLLESSGARLTLRDPRLSADELRFRIRLENQMVSIEKLTSNLNGGSMEANGRLQFSGKGIVDVDIRAGASNVALDFPAGLRSLLDADLTIRSRDELIVIGGTAHILEGYYREQLDLQGEVLRYLRSDQSLNLTEEPDPFLSKIRYGIGVDTRETVLVDNNLAKLALDANLEVTGTYYRPVVTGRITLQEGGELFFNERKYYIERGIIDLQNPMRIEPSIDLLAKTAVGSREISLQITGTPDNLTSSLTSPTNPELTEPDIVSLLITGRTLEEAQGAQLNVAKEQALSYLVGRMGTRLSQQAEQTLGLSQVRLEPNLIATESDPGARLTIGQNITSDLQFIYSMNLANSQDQIWIADYKPMTRFDTRATRQSDSSFRFDFRHDLRFGGLRPPAASSLRRTEFRIGKIEFQGNTLLPESNLRDKFPFSTGDRYDYFKVRRGTDTLEKLYFSRHHLEAKIRSDRDEQNQTVNFTFHVNPGPKVDFKYEGYPPSGDLRKEIRRAWEDGVFDQQRISDAVRLIRESLVKDSYLKPEVGSSVIDNPAGNEKRVVFRINSGARYPSLEWSFKGASAIPGSDLKRNLEDAGQKLDVFLAPERIPELLQRVYRNQGYLDARIEEPRLELNPDTAQGRVTISVEEGPRYEFGRVSFQGNVTYSDAALEGAIGLFSGRPYRPESLSDAMEQLQDYYWRNGFNDVAVNYSIEKRQGAPLLDVNFSIVENRQQTIDQITVHGNDRTGEKYVRSRLTFSQGEILDYTKLNQSRKQLYDTGAYSQVQLKSVDLGDAGGKKAGTRPVEIQVNLREVKPYRINYGAFYDTDRGPGGIVEFTRQNLWGAARQWGLNGRYDGDIHEIRGYYGQPFLRNYPLKTSGNVFLRRELNPTFLNDRIGFSLSQEGRIRNNLVLSYGYRYERTHTYDRDPDPLFPFDITLPVAYLSSSLTRDARDDLLDATKGSFTSHTFEYAPKFLGSDIRLIRYFGQYFHYVPLSKPSTIPLSGGVSKSRLVYAGAVRLGIAKGLGGQSVPPSERFFAGGGTTVRGFEQNSLGPVDFEGSPVGGDAMFVVNNEIRFPIVSIFDGTAFFDLGNVYRTVSDLDPLSVRKSAGIGLRVRTPFLLLRLDYGFKLDQKPGEKLGRLYFSIGQAF